MLPIITPIHLFTTIISIYVASTFPSGLIILYLVTHRFCINTSSVVLIVFCQSDEYLPRVQLSIILQILEYIHSS